MQILPNQSSVRVLRLAILASGKTLLTISRSVGCSTATLSNIANGLYEPGDGLREKLAAYFEMDESRLFRRLLDECPWLRGRQ